MRGSGLYFASMPDTSYCLSEAVLHCQPSAIGHIYSVNDSLKHKLASLHKIAFILPMDIESLQLML